MSACPMRGSVAALSAAQTNVALAITPKSKGLSNRTKTMYRAAIPIELSPRAAAVQERPVKNVLSRASLSLLAVSW